MFYLFQSLQYSHINNILISKYYFLFVLILQFNVLDGSISNLPIHVVIYIIQATLGIVLSNKRGISKKKTAIASELQSSRAETSAGPYKNADFLQAVWIPINESHELRTKRSITSGYTESRECINPSRVAEYVR